jgi:acyl-CoA synthetase (AMP-forming)/AMP-acid ligase II
MEEVLAAHPDVAECAVMGVADAMKGQLPLGLLVLSADGGSWTMPATIEDAGALDGVTLALRGLGYTKGEAGVGG